MRECWLSPYGEVIYTGCSWGHANTAAKIIFERYNNGKFDSPQEVWLLDKYDSPTDFLEELGWVRFSTITNRWVILKTFKLTPSQKDKIFELTGDIFE